MLRVEAIGVAQVVTLLLVAAQPSYSQTVKGTLVDHVSGREIAGAIVVLLDVTDRIVATSESSVDGSFQFAVSPGDYRLHASNQGYVESRSPWFYAGADSIKEVRFLVEPSPHSLPGVEVSVSSLAEIMTRLRMREEDLGHRIIRREVIDRHQAARDAADVLAWQNLPGMRIVRASHLAEQSKHLAPADALPDLCASFPRGKHFDGFQSCALWVIDGSPTSDENVLYMDPADLEAIIVLTPSEATLLYGTGAYGGAVLLFTRQGRS